MLNSTRPKNTKAIAVCVSVLTVLPSRSLANICAEPSSVEPNKKYTLSFWLKTEDLKSAGTPTIEIINANDGKLITASKSFPTGTNGWQQITVDFNAPENAEAVTVRTGRAYCGDHCPIFGIFWYDDFQLKK